MQCIYLCLNIFFQKYIIYIYTYIDPFPSMYGTFTYCSHMNVNEASISSSTLGSDLSGEPSHHPKLLPSGTTLRQNGGFQTFSMRFFVFLPRKKTNLFFFSENIHDSPWISAKVRAPKALKLGLRREMLGGKVGKVGRKYDTKPV